MSGKVSHVVLFEFDSRYSKELQEQATADSGTLLSIPGVVSVQFGPTFTTDRSKNWTHVLVVVLDSKESLPGYGPHPNHAAWASKYVKPYVKQICGVDVNTEFHSSL